MAKNKQEFKVGDLVRVARSTDPMRTQHYHDFGVVGVVAGPADRHGDYTVEAPAKDGHTYQQWVPGYCLKLARQAMRKRDEYAARR